ncbi:hypothetical protein FGB62_20g010 [Gracilaria domingensis]|nr:hypothetical protein FGB62_20g010 [Gracilaria domingensis]
MEKALKGLNQVMIDRYLTWHHSVVSKVRSGELDGSSVRTLVFIGNEGRHGLGDRLRGLLFAYMASVFSQRLLLIKWEDPFPLSTVLVNSDRSNFTFDESLFPLRWKPDGEADATLVQRALLADMQLFIGNEARLSLECEPRPKLDEVFETVKKFPNLTTSVELKKVVSLKRRPTSEQFFPLIFKALVRPSTELRKMMTETIDKHNMYAPSRLWKEGPLRRIDTSDPFISVHARLGYGVGEYIKRFKAQMYGHTMDSLAYCMAEKAMRLAEQEGITNPPRFYVATDTAEIRLKLKRALTRMDPNERENVRGLEIVPIYLYGYLHHVEEQINIEKLIRVPKFGYLDGRNTFTDAIQCAQRLQTSQVVAYIRDKGRTILETGTDKADA